jgi:pimeloyl-ACP methyl ester carboxylesterase
VRGLGVLALLYVAIVAVLLCLEDRLLYRRHERGGIWLPPPSGSVGEELWLHSADGEAIHAWWAPRAGSADAVIFFHGNTGNLSWARREGGDVTKIGEILNASVLVFDYPGFGYSSGTPSEAGCYAAADAAYEWLVERVPAEHVILLGQSLGGGVATELAARRPHRALALYKTFLSVPDVVLSKFPLVPAHALMQNCFDNQAKIEDCGGPVFIAHGDCDHLIPVGHAERLFEAARAPKELFVMPGCGHHGGLSREMLQRLAEFLRTLSPTR